MGPDYYKVEVLHFVNPHLIWVFVREDKLAFDQIGLYGILPLNMTINIDGRVTSENSEVWMPAAVSAMQKALQEASEVWFSPTYIDKKTSIFDDNSHKYGEILIKHKNERTFNLIEIIADTGSAKQDECLFHQMLGNGSFNTKLNYVATIGVVKKLEDAYKTLNIPLKLWDAALKSQMTVFCEAMQLEAKMIPRNLEAHNRENSQSVLHNKLNDLRLCKDIDDESAGRATVRHSQMSKLHDLKNKLALLRVKNNDTIDIKPDGKVKDTIKVNTSINNNNEKAHGQNVSKTVEARVKDYIEANPNIGSNDKVDVQKKSVRDVSKTVDVVKKEFADGNKNDKSADGWVDDVDGTTDFVRKVDREGKKPKQNIKPDKKLIGFAPPGINPQHIAFKPKETVEIEAQERITQKKEDSTPFEPEMKQDIFAKEDSEVNIKISNLDCLKTKFPSFVNKQANIENIKPKATKTVVEPAQNVDDNVPKHRNNAMKERLGILKAKMAKMNESLSSSSDKDNRRQSDESDTDSITSLVNKLDLSNSSTKRDIEIVEMKDNIKNNVNPFKNLDGSQSVFVDKLVSPTLMVHTKKGNRIQATCNLRDVPFGTDIHIVLRNMSIKSPMRLQTVSWPTILRGHSLFLVSPYASGKTIGYLPAVCRLVSDVKDNRDNGLSCVILCATSNSVADVENICKLFLHKAKIFACFTGMSDLHITTSVLNGCDLLICTPTMFVRLLQGAFSIDLKNLSTLVVDDCERISEVYANELKYSLLKVNETVKSRVNKEFKVQYVLASRIWCDFMTPLAKKVPDTVVCIGGFHECVLYSKAKTSVDFVKKENKVDAALNFLGNIDSTKKTVIACKSDDEVKLLEKTLTHHKYVVFACDSTMDVQDLYAIDTALRDYKEPTKGPILVCRDDNLSHLNVSDSNYLIHYSLPDLFSLFCKRFAVLIENYRSIFKSEESEVKIKVLLEDSNVEQLPKILNFIKRCTDNIPATLNEISSKVLTEKDFKKAEDLIPLCNSLLTLGKCPDFWNCKERHTVFKDFDEPKKWIPNEGIITFQILHYNSAVNYSARLLSNIKPNDTVKYPQNFSLLTLKMGMYYSKEANKKLLGIPKLGDVCAVTLKQNLFVRCQVMKVLKTSTNGQPHVLLIKLIDEEKYEMARDTCLYYLPDELKNIETHVAKVILANVMPRDRDITYTDLARNHLKKITDKHEDVFLRGKISHVISNFIFVESLEACQELSSLGEIIVKSNFRQELLDGHAIPNPEHIDVLINISKEIINATKEIKCDISADQIHHRPVKKINHKPRWAHLDTEFSSVFFLSAQHPEKFFIRLTKYKDCIDSLIKDIKKHIEEVPTLEDFKVGDVVIAEFPDDSIFERARIDAIINHNKVKCFFVDQGDWREVNIQKIYSITEKLITQLPFQAIECRLVGIQPVGSNWTDFATNWLVDSCFDSKGDLKYLYAKYFTKEKAESTDGHKYGLVLLDTYAEEDVIINDLIVQHNLAKNNDETEFLKDIDFKRESSKESDMEWTDVSAPVTDSKLKNEIVPVQSVNKPMGAPLRSFPLVGSDDDDDDRWCIENPKHFAQIMNNFLQPTEVNPTKTETVKIQPLPTDNRQEKTLLTTDNKNTSPTIDKIDSSGDLNKPKILWRQTQKNVVLKIQLSIESRYEMVIKESYVKFNARANDVEYGFKIDLYGVVDVKNSYHSNKGLYIQVNLKKIICRKWRYLARNVGSSCRWIVYDVDNIDVSSEEEDEECRQGLKNIAIKTADSDSDDDFYDDTTFQYT